MSHVFHRKVHTLAAGLEHDQQRDAARRGTRYAVFSQKIVIPRGDGLLQVMGNFGEMLTAEYGRSRSAAGSVG